jgi:hypothetical protein
MKTITSLFKLTSVALAVVAASFSANAQDLTFSGSVDTYFKSTPGYGQSAAGSSFANGTGFSMGMINLITSYEGEKSGVVADLVFGPRGIDAAFGAPYGGSLVNQMYAYYNVSDKVTLTFGQWNTYLGYEVISPTANFNYSTSYMFSWGPFSQAGLKANIALSDALGLTLAVMNPTDVLETNNVGGKGGKYTLGAQLSYSSDAGATYLNARYGDASGKLFQVDLTGGYDLGDAFYFGFNATLLDDNGAGFMGAAIYPKFSLSDDFSIGARAEYFAMTKGYLASDTDGDGILDSAPLGFDANGDGTIIDLTLSANKSYGNLTLIPEVRFDMGSENTFTDIDGKASKSMPTLILAAVYSF